ncbi:MAG: hypothetical protein EOS22_04795 [Mesorhizobium sp.]|nr:MAG: hypothetical protein EOS22_04795 [Mesorhizobium sp.]TJW70779.1 MAG: hypothetical protein E5V29_03270 [Mesorhizobium sp.]
MSKVRAGGSQNAEVAPTRLAAAQIEEAARWLAATTEPPRPLIPYLRKTFRLSAAEAIQVIRLANAARGLP